MKNCAVCDKELPQKSFDMEQWLMDQNESRCRECIGSDRVTRPNAESPNGFQGQDVPDHCYLCFGEGLDDSGQPLRRDCSCRNGTGHAHLSCLVEYAEHRAINRGDFEPWVACPNCHQRYRGELDLDLATERVAFCSQKYPDNELFLLEAMHHKLAALTANNRPNEAVDIAHKMITMIERAKAEITLPAPRSLLDIQANVHMMLGGIAYQGTNDGARAAVKHFEKSRDIFDGLGKDFSFEKSQAELNIAKAKIKLGEGSMNMEEMLDMEQNGYEKFIEECGQESVATIYQGVNVASCLKRAQRFAEAKTLLTKLATISRRAHGPNHKATKHVESRLNNLEMVEATDEDLAGEENSAEGKGKIDDPMKIE